MNPSPIAALALLLALASLGCASSRDQRCAEEQANRINSCSSDAACQLAFSLAQELNPCGPDWVPPLVGSASLSGGNAPDPCVSCAQGSCDQESLPCWEAASELGCASLVSCLRTHCAAQCPGVSS